MSRATSEKWADSVDEEPEEEAGEEEKQEAENESEGGKAEEQRRGAEQFDGEGGKKQETKEVAKKKVMLRLEPSASNVADLGTKHFTKERFDALRGMADVVQVGSRNIVKYVEQLRVTRKRHLGSHELNPA